MPRTKSTVPAGAVERSAFRYSPGDRHTYTWDGSSEHATVWQHSHTEDGALVLVRSPGEAVYMAGCARTASAFMDHVDRWRVARGTAP
jgi:hypothetical protein